MLVTSKLAGTAVVLMAASGCIGSSPEIRAQVTSSNEVKTCFSYDREHVSRGNASFFGPTPVCISADDLAAERLHFHTVPTFLEVGQCVILTEWHPLKAVSRVVACK